MNVHHLNVSERNNNAWCLYCVLFFNLFNRICQTLLSVKHCYFLIVLMLNKRFEYDSTNHILVLIFYGINIVQSLFPQDFTFIVRKNC